MPSILVVEQQFMPEPVSKSDHFPSESLNRQEQHQQPPLDKQEHLPRPYVDRQEHLLQQHHIAKQEQPSTTNTMASIAAIAPTYTASTQQPQDLYYESFLESISNDIVQYLSTKRQQQNESPAPASLTPTPTPRNHHRKRSSTGRPDKPQGVDRKRHKHTN